MKTTEKCLFEFALILFLFIAIGICVYSAMNCKKQMDILREQREKEVPNYQIY